MDNRHRGFLLLAAGYNLVWGLFIYHFSTAYLKWISDGSLTAHPLIAAVGLGILLMGVFFIAGALRPQKYKWMIVIATLAKVAGIPLWYYGIMKQEITKKFVFHLLMNDLIWLIPLGIIVFRLFTKPTDYK